MKLNAKKSLLVAGVVSSVALATAGAGVVSAATSTSNNGQDSLVQKIADKFHLNKDQVKAVFDEEHAARQAEHQKANEARLTQAVSDGKITEAQKTLILAKQAELKADMDANRDSMKDKTPAERKAAMEAKRTELQKWATDNNIPIEYLHFGHGPGGPGGHGPDGPDHTEM